MSVARDSPLRGLLGEGARYLAASGIAFVVDFGLYVALIRVAGVHYLVAAPVAFALATSTERSRVAGS